MNSMSVQPLFFISKKQNKKNIKELHLMGKKSSTMKKKHLGGLNQ